MDRSEIRDQIRLSTVVEDTNVSDAELDEIINSGIHFIDGYYPFPVTIVELGTDGASPAFAEQFHWILVNWGIAKLMEREEYFDVAAAQMQEVQVGLRSMAKFYTRGRT